MLRNPFHITPCASIRAGRYIAFTIATSLFPDYLQKMKASQAEGNDGPSTLLQQYLPRLHTPPEDSGREEERVAEEEGKGEERENDDAFLPPDRPVQKNKKRCWSCKIKLELAQRELGGCKCGKPDVLYDSGPAVIIIVSFLPPWTGYVFCAMHRLPEQHSCIYDHKEGGRNEALKSMVPASKKKIGRSFHRIDSRPE